nr:hypothetical protein Iba_chr04eCG5400 [Ipomoea batatas]GMD44493.1 hypothetical protein Iba_scaffold45933CG0010 [Ipomoea batatas]
MVVKSYCRDSTTLISSTLLLPSTASQFLSFLFFLRLMMIKMQIASTISSPATIETTITMTFGPLLPSSSPESGGGGDGVEGGFFIRVLPKKGLIS